MSSSKPQKDSSPALGVFVYGTLMRGLHNHALARSLGLASVETAFIDQHQLFNLDRGYPAVFPGVGRVWGQLLKFHDLRGALGPLDELESEGFEYQRVPCFVTVTRDNQPAASAWIYRYPSFTAIERAGGKRIQSGRYENL